MTRLPYRIEPPGSNGPRPAVARWSSGCDTASARHGYGSVTARSRQSSVVAASREVGVGFLL
jgi:hypothetical protein